MNVNKAAKAASSEAASFSKETESFVKKELTRYETNYSAIIPSLFCIQKEKGWVPPEAVPYLAKIMGIPEAHINEVLYFYTMFNKTPVAKIHAQVCTNISCAMNGGRELANALCQHFGETNSTVTISRVECLGSCGTAPMMQVNDCYLENLSPELAIRKLTEMGAKANGR